MHMFHRSACLRFRVGAYGATAGAVAVVAACLMLGACAAAPSGDDASQTVEPTPADAQLAERALAVQKRVQGTAGQEQANRLNLARMKQRLAQLKGEKPATGEALEVAREKVGKVVDTASKGPTWPAPPIVRAPRFSGAPRIDGVVDESVWQQAAVFDETYRFNSAEPVESFDTRWRVGWDRTHLYFAFECTDRDLVAPEIERDGPVYAHDCVEMFILPRFETGSYWELIVSPSGSILDVLHAKRFDGWGAASQFEREIEGLEVGVHVDGTLNKPGDRDNGYTVEVAIPFEQLPEYSRATPAAGQTLHLMLCRLNKTGDKMTPYAFTPLLSWGHNIWNHAELRLVEGESGE